jgi:hypothetical protein
MASGGNLPNEEQGRNHVRNAYDLLMGIQNKYQIEFNRS